MQCVLQGERKRFESKNSPCQCTAVCVAVRPAVRAAVRVVVCVAVCVAVRHSPQIMSHMNENGHI